LVTKGAEHELAHICSGDLDGTPVEGAARNQNGFEEFLAYDDVN